MDDILILAEPLVHAGNWWLVADLDIAKNNVQLYLHHSMKIRQSFVLMQNF